jgi:phosphatidate phosphatase PAH1
MTLPARDAFDGSSPDNDDDTENDTTDDRVEHIGDGISSEPVLYMEDEDIIIQDTDSDIIVKDVRGHLRRIIVRAWRQRYQ